MVLKPGDRVLLHTEAYLKNNFPEKDIQNMFYTNEVCKYLGKEVTIRKVVELIDKSTGFYIVGDALTPIFEERMINKQKVTQEERGITMNSLKVKAFEEMLKLAIMSSQEHSVMIGAGRRCGKSFMIDTMLKMPATTPAKTKFLTLNVINGQANVKEIIHQAYFAGIKDPRPFIQDMLKKELTRLHNYLETITPLRSNLGFNLKLRGMFESLLTISKKPAKLLTLEDAVKIYEFQKAYDTYQVTVQANNGVCPYQWIETHLTHDNLNSIKTVELFFSNKIQIFIKNGLIIYREETAKVDCRFELEIKFSVADNKFSL